MTTEIDFSRLEKKIGIKFNDQDLLKRAFTHRSYLNENNRPGLQHNERLEFLGDAVLELASTHYLFERYPDKSEGDLTSIRAAVVNTQSLANASQDLGLNEFLLLSKGEKYDDKSKARSHILANTFEALLGAIYLDQGYEVVERFINDALHGVVDDIVKSKSYRDSKSLVQEKAQEVLGITPAYKVMEEIGPDHAKEFVIGIFFDDKQVASGKGSSKQEAEQNAARNALEANNWTE